MYDQRKSCSFRGIIQTRFAIRFLSETHPSLDYICNQVQTITDQILVTCRCTVDLPAFPVRFVSLSMSTAFFRLYLVFFRSVILE